MKDKLNIPSVHVSNFEVWTSKTADLTVDEKVRKNCRITELKARIKNMKIWRRELERSVVWQREERWRLQEKMGIDRNDGGNGRVQGEQGWSVGGKTWEKGR